MKIGILSDTHNLLWPEVIANLHDCDHILHTGDISSAFIRDQLEQIAPVKAVRGNADKEWADELPEKRLVPTSDMRKVIETVVGDTQKGRSVDEITAKRKLDCSLVEQIVRLYVTHPGVTVDGIMTKMGV